MDAEQDDLSGDLDAFWQVKVLELSKRSIPAGELLRKLG
jgi:hypothetical protein